MLLGERKNKIETKKTIRLFTLFMLEKHYDLIDAISVGLTQQNVQIHWRSMKEYIFSIFNAVLKVHL